MSPAQAVSYERRPCVRQNRVVLAVVATVKSCGGGTGVNRRGVGEFREATEAKRIRLRGEHGISRPTIAQGRPRVRRHLYAAVRSPCATFSRSGPRVSIGTRSSLRPLRKRRATDESKTRAFGAARMPVHAYFKKMKWCCQTGLNCRPLHYQWSALPLSYGSNAGIRIGRHRGPTKRADFCHRPPRCASLQGRPKRENRGDIGDITGFLARNDRLSADFGSASPPTGQLAAGADSTHFGFRTIGPRRPLELPQSLRMLSRTAVWDP